MKRAMLGRAAREALPARSMGPCLPCAERKDLHRPTNTLAADDVLHLRLRAAATPKQHYMANDGQRLLARQGNTLQAPSSACKSRRQEGSAGRVADEQGQGATEPVLGGRHRRDKHRMMRLASTPGFELMWTPDWPDLKCVRLSEKN